jgi:hypothetical protein
MIRWVFSKLTAKLPDQLIRKAGASHLNPEELAVGVVVSFGDRWTRARSMIGVTGCSKAGTRSAACGPREASRTACHRIGPVGVGGHCGWLLRGDKKKSREAEGNSE